CIIKVEVEYGTADFIVAVLDQVNPGSDRELEPVNDAKKARFTAVPMQIQILKSKIHRAFVTGASLNYEGSLSIDAALMDKVGLFPYERVLCSNLANGERFETYVIPAESGSG